MDEFLDDLETGKIQFRDKWQFELKSNLFPLSYNRNNIISQEFYFFIPNSLQINEETYSKLQFYQDQTNLIRLKTPAFSFNELIDLNNAESPLVRIQLLAEYEQTKENEGLILDEVKLLGNIFHSAIRNKISNFMSALERMESPHEEAVFNQDFNDFLDKLEQFKSLFSKIKNKCIMTWSSSELQMNLTYIDEFISLNITDYLTAFLNRLRLKLKDVFKPWTKGFAQSSSKRTITAKKDSTRKAIFQKNPNITSFSYTAKGF